jgi:hypothetical protein
MESSVSFSSSLVDTAERMVRDMKFVGIFAVIYGIIACLTIIGMIFGIPYIFIGIRLREAGDNFEQYIKTGNEQDLLNAFQKQGSSFFIMKVILIIGLVFLVLYLLIIIMYFIFVPETLY